MSAEREHFSSKLGFILAAAGSAVGIGNLVGFPVNAAKNGGGAFLVMYAIFVFVICLPVMMAEMAMGRNTERAPVGAYGQLSNNNSWWRRVGILGVLTPFMIGVFYMVITIWLFAYLVFAVTGNLDFLASAEGFSTIINSNYIFGAMIAVALVVYVILNSGVKDGIERAAKIMMPALFIILLALVVFVLTLDNASAGISFYLVPEISKLTPEVISGALSQAFFSLSLGMGILITYGSYISKKGNIVSSAKLVALTDTAVAFIAGLMILPAVFSFNPQIQGEELSDSSVSMIFVFLPKIFLALQTTIGYVPASIIASVFFLLVFFAAITSLVSIIEVPVAYMMDERDENRHNSLLKVSIIGGTLTIMAATSLGMVDFFTNFTSYAGQSKSFFDVIIDIFYDTILPLNGLLVCLFVSYRWKKSGLAQELTIGHKDYPTTLMAKYVNFSLRTFIPFILLCIFLNTVALKFFAYDIFA